MTINRICGAFALVLILSACAKDAREVRSTDNPTIPVSTLFTHEGCTVYRFNDAGRYVYYANCGGGSTSVNHRDSCGKNCTRDYVVNTSYSVQEE